MSVPALALVLLALYGLLALGLRMLVQLRRTGSTGFKGLSGSPGSIEWITGVLLATAIVVCVAGPLLELLDAVGPVAALDGDVGTIVGAGLASVGIVLTVVAQFAMGEAWRIGVDPAERTELVTRGPFSVVRNPIFSAMIPAFIGIALLAPNVVTIAGAILLIAALELQTRFVEEPHLLRVQGDRYAAYAAQVGRFLPRIGRLQPNDKRERVEEALSVLARGSRIELRMRNGDRLAGIFAGMWEGVIRLEELDAPETVELIDGGIQIAGVDDIVVHLRSVGPE